MKEKTTTNVVVENPGSDDTEIDLVELFYVFLNRIWLLVMCLVIGGAAAFAWTACFIKPVYKTSAELYVVSASNNSVVNLADLQLGSAVKSDYMELMLSRPVLEKVIENLNLNKSVKQLQKMISITNKSDTRILQIITTSTDPQLATDVANELATQAILMLPEIMENEPPNLVSTALFPTAPAGPSIVKNTLLGAGIMLAAGEVPRIAQQFGLDSSVKVNMSSVIYSTNSAVNLARNIMKPAAA